MSNLKNNIQKRFIVPPFSVLDTKQEYWLDRRRKWLNLGIKSELGRDECKDLSSNNAFAEGQDRLNNSINNIVGKSMGWVRAQKDMNESINRIKTNTFGTQGSLTTQTGISIFDPVLCELMYKWFNIKNGKILDPFAGGSVRGIIASELDYDYLGIELREKQVLSNIEQSQKICEKQPKWLIGDSDLILDSIEDNSMDFIFSCPPYHDLEIYSDDINDLSNMSYEKFMIKYESIIKKSIDKLKNDRFTCFVVSEIRDREGKYKGFVNDTINCFNKNGMKYYNEFILVNSIGTLPFRITIQFNNGRKNGRMHQYVLVFYKGDISKIKQNFDNFIIDNGVDNTWF